MVGCGETYIAAFVLFAGYGSLHSGLISILPVSIGAVLQILFLKFFSSKFSFKKQVVLFCVVQSISLAIISSLALLANTHIVLIYAVVTIYWASGLIGSVGWNAWMSDYLPPRLRISFYSKRSRFSQFFVFIGILFGGLFLQLYKPISENPYPFVILFLVASLLRLASSYHISQQTETPPRPQEDTWTTDSRLRQVFMNKDIIRVIIYIFLLQMSVNIAAPYFNPYMLKNMGLNYFEYVFITSFTFLTRVFCMNLFAQFSRFYGSFKSIVLGTIILALPPVLWTFSHNLIYICVLQIISGIGWGLQDLGLSLFLIEKVKSASRSQVFTMVSALSGLGMIVGSLVGGFYLEHFQFTDQAFVMVFAASTLLRFAVILSLLKISKTHFRLQSPIFWRIIAVRPTLGVIVRPLFIGKKGSRSKIDKN